MLVSLQVVILGFAGELERWLTRLCFLSSALHSCLSCDTHDLIDYAPLSHPQVVIVDHSPGLAPRPADVMAVRASSTSPLKGARALSAKSPQPGEIRFRSSNCVMTRFVTQSARVLAANAPKPGDADFPYGIYGILFGLGQSALVAVQSKRAA